MNIDSDGGELTELNRRPGVARSKRILLFGLTFSALVNVSLALPATAEPSPPQSEMTPQEMNVLPPYCRAQRFLQDEQKWPVSQAEKDKWNRILGPGYEHLHHYCYALNSINRAQKSADETSRRRYFENARANIEYVQRNCARDFVLMPEFCVKRGYVLRMLGHHAVAAREFIRAMSLRPDYVPAYTALSEYYVDLGNLEEAERVLQQGLEHAPRSRLLTTKLDELQFLKK